MSDHQTYMLDMLLLCFQKDQDVTQEDKEVFVQDVTQDVIHQGLEHRSGIVKAKIHDQVHKMVDGNVESCCPLVSITSLVLQVEFEENSDLMECAESCVKYLFLMVISFRSQ